MLPGSKAMPAHAVDQWNPPADEEPAYMRPMRAAADYYLARKRGELCLHLLGGVLLGGAAMHLVGLAASALLAALLLALVLYYLVRTVLTHSASSLINDEINSKVTDLGPPPKET